MHRWIGVGDFASQKFDLVAYRQSDSTVYNDVTMPSMTGQPYLEAVAYVDSHPQPSGDGPNGTLPTALQDFYGSISLTNAKTITQYHRTGDVSRRKDEAKHLRIMCNVIVFLLLTSSFFFSTLLYPLLLCSSTSPLTTTRPRTCSCPLGALTRTATTGPMVAVSGRPTTALTCTSPSRSCGRVCKGAKGHRPFVPPRQNTPARTHS